jgi:hypothetical protein
MTIYPFACYIGDSKSQNRKKEKMSTTGNFQESITAQDAREQQRLQLAEYVAQQPPSRQAFHRWMKALEIASLVIVAALFILALVLSFNWKNVQTQAIPTAWFVFAGSLSLTMLLVGLHAVILQAFPPVGGLRSSIARSYAPFSAAARQSKFVTGRAATNLGWGTVVLALVTAAFWGVFAYAAWTLNLAILAPMITFLGVLLGVTIAASIIYSLIRSIYRSLSHSH